MEKFVKTFEIFVAHPWTIERKYKYSYGTKMTIQIDQKIFGQKKIGDTLVDRMIPIYKCAPPPPPPSTPSSKNFQKKEKNKKKDSLRTEKPVN